MNILIEKNVMVPMRDGVKLATDVYRPAEGGPVPVLLARLPYNKNLPTMMQRVIDAPRAVQAGYAVVLQDCRGRFSSEGEFTPIFNEAHDGVDTVTWITQQPWSTGQVYRPGRDGGTVLPWVHPVAPRQGASRSPPGDGTCLRDFGLLSDSIALSGWGVCAWDDDLLVCDDGTRGTATTIAAGQGQHARDGDSHAHD